MWHVPLPPDGRLAERVLARHRPGCKKIWKSHMGVTRSELFWLIALLCCIELQRCASNVIREECPSTFGTYKGDTYRDKQGSPEMWRVSTGRSLSRAPAERFPYAFFRKKRHPATILSGGLESARDNWTRGTCAGLMRAERCPAAHCAGVKNCTRVSCAGLAN